MSSAGDHSVPQSNGTSRTAPGVGYGPVDEQALLESEPSYAILGVETNSAQERVLHSCLFTQFGEAGEHGGPVDKADRKVAARLFARLEKGSSTYHLVAVNALGAAVGDREPAPVDKAERAAGQRMLQQLAARWS